MPAEPRVPDRGHAESLRSFGEDAGQKGALPLLRAAVSAGHIRSLTYLWGGTCWGCGFLRALVRIIGPAGRTISAQGRYRGMEHAKPGMTESGRQSRERHGGGSGQG